MLKCLQCINWKKTGIFAAGVAFGTAGIKLLSSKDAKKVYTNCAAAVLRAKDSVMKTVSTVQANTEDILAEAKQINEERAAQEEAQNPEEAAPEADAPAEGTEPAEQESAAQQESAAGPESAPEQKEN